ncbi:uncharacterized protein LOC6559448 [Drosophila grimshawi]|uniref:GH20908 n=1 Tax=Drosophila grimshawi TaxID=7222 RepID=B4J4T0_DROGR|nr:uncharacterized protein LOC6559448 [Drosophila grimshawi]EDW00626.1 GH20908 [Drosophila grimshawi]
MKKKVLLLLLLLLLLLPIGGFGIVNPSNESANMVIYMLPEKDVGPQTWQVGVDCLDSFAQIFFYRNPQQRFTRSYNLMLTNAFNMSMTAAQIQEGFSKRINEAISDTEAPRTREYFQLRVISDHYNVTKFFGELLLADNYVFIVDSLSHLRSLVTDYVSKNRSWNPGARFLVLYHNAEMMGKPFTVATRIFSAFRTEHYVHRVALLFADTPTDYNLLVNDYYSDVDCRVSSVQTVGNCSNGELHPSPHAVQVAMQDFINGFSPKNCTFYVCAAIAAPFVEEDCVIGIEMRILGFMRNRLQFVTNQTCTRETRGEVDDEGNWNGLLGKLSNGECDFILGGFYPDNEVIGIFWGTDTYLQDAHTWFVQLAEKRPPWLAMVAIFKVYTWTAFLVVLLISWLLWYALVTLLPEPPYYQQLSLTAINALAVSICAAIQERPICDATRILFLMLTIYGLNVVAIYTSKLIATFQDPGLLHQLDELHEVVAAGIPFGGDEESRDWFENNDDMWIFNAYNDTRSFRPHGVNLVAVEQGLRCILSSRMYIMQSTHADDIYAFPDNVFISPIQMITKAGFPFLYEMNMLIRYMRDVGIIHKIDSDFRYNNTYLNRIAKMRPDFAETVIVLTTQHLKGPFGILIVGICSASLTFVGELLYGYRRHKRRQRRTRSRGRRRRAAGNWYRERRQVRKAVAPVVRFTPVKRRKVL